RLTGLHETLIVGPYFPDVGKPVRWIEPSFFQPFPVMGQLAVSPADSHAIARGATSAELTGTVTVLRPHVFATLPLRAGAFAEHDGRFVRLYSVSRDTNSASVGVHSLSPSLDGQRHLQFAIVNYAR